jgi:DNA gyrase subunit A
MSMLRHVDFDSETRESYLRGDLPAADHERLALLEEHILTISENGYGKRTSAYEYRITGRGGSGIANIDLTEKTGPVVASFPVGHADEIMLVTDLGKLIRFAVDDVRIAGRRTQGVMLLRTAEDECVVSAARLGEVNGNEEDAGGEGEEPDGDGQPPETAG